MSDKMREEFEKWYMTNTFAHIDHISVFYSDLNCYPAPISNHCWKAWQAAQSVPEHIRSIKIPTDTMEQEFQNHYRRGYEAGKNAAQAVPVAGKHPSHTTRSSDASSFDEVCINCGAKDISGAGWGDLAKPCSKSVPVVGDVLFFASESTETADSQIRYDVCADKKDYSFFPVVRKPANSITAAELATLREKAAMVEAEISITVGGGLSVRGTYEAIARVQAHILIDSSHAVESQDNRRYLMRQLEKAEKDATQELDELRKDAERLQFMIDETAILMYSGGIDRTLCRVEWPLTGYVQDAFYPSERAAIDAAMRR